MFGRLLRFLFALPVALVATAGLAYAAVAAVAIPIVFTSLHPPQIKIDDPRGEKAVDDPPSVAVADEDQPKFPGGFPQGSAKSAACACTQPAYPVECKAAARAKETVLVEFDITPDGSAVNLRVLDSTNSCLDKAAVAGVERWKCEPELDADGAPRWRRGVQTAIDFELAE